MAIICNQVLAFLMFSFLTACSVRGQELRLSEDYYKTSCPNVDVAGTVQSVIVKRVTGAGGELRMGASLLRLCFHDCFVNGCDGGPLLDADEFGESEKTDAPNFKSLRGFDVIDEIKTAFDDKKCPVSCADIVVLAARESVVALGGATWKVELGRLDTRKVDVANAMGLPGPSSNLAELVALFKIKDGIFNFDDFVSLVGGGHTIGQGQCQFITNDRLKSDNNIDEGYKASLIANCTAGGDTLQSLDNQTTTVFDNKIFDDLINKKGFFHSDQELYNSVDPASREFLDQTKAKVDAYNKDQALFFTAFGNAMIKLANLARPYGIEVRAKCREINQLIPPVKSLKTP